MATRARPIDLWAIVRSLERQVHALSTSSRAADPVWIPATYQNGWVDYGGAHQGARYRSTAGGQVEVQGLVKNGTALSTVFTLPAGYRPAAELVFTAVTSANVLARVDVQADGQVVQIAGNNTYLSLNFSFTPG